MPCKLRTPGGERTLNAVLTLLWGIALCWIGVRFWLNPNLGIAGWLLLVIGLPLAVTAVLLWFRRGWARWPATGLLSLLALAQGWGLMSRGFGWGRALILVGLAWTAYDVFRHFSPDALAKSRPDSNEAPDGSSRPMISLALLLRRPRHLDATTVARYCEAAWGGTYRVVSSGDASQPSVPNEKPGWVTGRSPFLLVGSPDGLFVVHNHDRPYFDAVAEGAEGTRDLHLREVLLENRAWIAVDLMAPTDESVPREALYPAVARLIAALAGPDCQAIYRPETEQISPWDDSLEERLHGPDALSLFAA